MDNINAIRAEVNHVSFQNNSVKKFEAIFDESSVLMEIVGSKLTMKIEGRKKIQEIESLLFELLSLLYIYLGGFPQIETVKVNNLAKNLCDLQTKYFTDDRFCKEYYSTCDVNIATMNDIVLDKFRQIKQIPIASMQYLVSRGYKSVVPDHKITLMLHVIEGIVEKRMLCKLHGKTDIKGGIKGASNYLCQNYFFKYQEKFDCEILQLLQVTENRFIKNIWDTRDWYSHLLNSDQKPDRLKKGSDMIIYFEILMYAARLLIMDLLEVPYDESKIAEFYYVIHDWLQDVFGKKNQPLKSRTYRNCKSIEEAMIMLHNIGNAVQVNKSL